MTDKYKFLEFDEQKVHNDFWHLIREKASEIEVLAAQKQHSRDRIIMEKLLEANRVLREALAHTNDFCLCRRNTTGFDYHEEHPVQGLPKSGSRWLTPRDYNKNALAEADEIMKGIE